MANLATAHAQKEYVTKGVFEFGGSAYFYSSKFDVKGNGEKICDVTYRRISVIPTVGYFVADSIYLGGEVKLTRSSFELKNDGNKFTIDGSEIAFFFAPTLVGKIEGMNVYPFVGAFIGGGTLKGEAELAGEVQEEELPEELRGKVEADGSLIECGIQGGLKFKVIEGGLLNVGLRTTLGGRTLFICGFSLYR